MADSTPTNSPAQVVRQLGELWGRQSKGKRGAAIGIAALVLGGVLFTSLTHHGESYEKVGEGASPDQAVELKRVLDEHHIQSRIAKDGSLEVVSERKDEAITAISNAGGFSNIKGFELFEQTGLGETSTTENVKFQRALQGELARSITSIAQIENARVTVAFGHHAVLKEQEQPPTASVVLKLHAGQVLTRTQVEGIRALVANAVNGLKQDAVVIVDNHGNPLDSNSDGSGDKKADIERDLAGKVRRQLETTVGAGKVSVVASVEVDERKTSETQDLYDKDNTVVRSETRTVEGNPSAVTAPAAASGVAGTAGNLPGTQGGGGGGGGGSGAGRLQEAKNYEISHTIKQIQGGPAEIKRIHLAVLVDTKTDKDGKPVERDKAEMEVLAGLARTGAGLDDKRGDKLEIHSMPFAPTEEAPAAAPAELPSASFAGIPTEYLQMAALGGGVLFVLFVALSLRRRSKRAARAAKEAAKQAELAAMAKLPSLAFPTPVAELERVLEARPVNPALDKGAELPGLPPGRPIQDRVIEIVSQDVQRAAEVLSAWLAEPPPKGAKP